MSEKADIHPRAEFEGLNAFLVYDCPKCGTNRHAMGGLPAGSSVTCGCGETIVKVAGHGGSKVQAGLDDVKHSLDDLRAKLKKLSK